MKLLHRLLAALGARACAAGLASAQTFPSRPITLYLPFPRTLDPDREAGRHQARLRDAP